MKPEDLNLRDLEYVLAVAQTRSFSQAAERCVVSQPALSKQIKNLEKTLGVQLFERNQRGVAITPAGKRFVEAATVVLDRAQNLIDTTLAHPEPLVGPLRLGVIASACGYLIPLCIGPLAQQYPQLQLWLKEGLTHQLITLLKQGELDAVIAANTVFDETLRQTPLFFEPFLLASPKQFKYKKWISPPDINTGQFLLLEDGHCLKDQTVSFCGLKEREPIQFQATSLETVLQMVALGLGVTVVPQLAVPTQSPLAKHLTFSQFKDKTIGREMILYTRKTANNQHHIAALATLIQSQIP